MKKSIIIVLTLLSLSITTAEYTFKFPLETSNGGALPNGFINIKNIGETSNWISTDPLYSPWTDSTSPYNCSNWSPNENTISVGQSFTQTATDCSKDQTRTRQNREQESTTLEYRDVGSPIIENQTIITSDTRNSVGTLENWVSITPNYTTWINIGGIYGCTNWNPAPSTVWTGQQFTQTATDCEQDQTRTRQNREQETTTLAYRNVGSPITENQTLTNITNTRTSTGTKTIDCRYSNISRWNQGTDTWLGKYQAIVWEDKMLYFEYAPHFNSYNHSGYRYTRGSYSHQEVTNYQGMSGKETITTNIYFICRAPL